MAVLSGCCLEPAANRAVVDPMSPMRTETGVGRNDPCPCGSGRKYKKCCLALDSMKKAFPLAPVSWSGLPVHGRPGIGTIWQGRRVRALWNRLYLRPPVGTFHEFLVNVLKWTVGDEWRVAEASTVEFPRTDDAEDGHQEMDPEPPIDGLPNFLRRGRPIGLNLSPHRRTASSP